MTDTEELVQLLRRLARSHLGTTSAAFDQAADTIERLAAARPGDEQPWPGMLTHITDAENFRGQLVGQLRQLRYGNADVEGTVTYIMDLIGSTKLVAVDAVMAEEVRKLRIENGHLQYVISTTTQPLKPVEDTRSDCSSFPTTFSPVPTNSDDEKMVREMVDYMISNQSMTAKQLSRGIIKIISRIRAEERERCAKIAETTYTVDGNDSMSEVDRWIAGNGIAAAIRTGDK